MEGSRCGKIVIPGNGQNEVGFGQLSEQLAREFHLRTRRRVGDVACDQHRPAWIIPPDEIRQPPELRCPWFRLRADMKIAKMDDFLMFQRPFNA